MSEANLGRTLSLMRTKCSLGLNVPVLSVWGPEKTRYGELCFEGVSTLRVKFVAVLVRWSMLEHFISQHGGAGLGPDCLVVREKFFPSGQQGPRPLCNSRLCLDQVQRFIGTNTGSWGWSCPWLWAGSVLWFSSLLPELFPLTSPWM